MSSTSPRAVVIGGGVAGTTCAAELAALAPAADVVLVDPAPAVKISSTISRLTRVAHEVDVTEQSAAAWCQAHGITFRRTRAAHLSTRSVSLVDGTELSFDVCCIATGASPFIPPVLADERFRASVLTLRDTDSVDALRARLRGARRVVVVGAGGIAMELVHEITGCDVVWVVKRHVGSSFFDERGARVVTGLFGFESLDNDFKTVEESRKGTAGQSEAQNNSCLPGSAVGPEWLGRRDGAMLLDENGRVIQNSTSARLQGSAAKKGRVRTAFSEEVVELREDRSSGWPILAVLSDGTVERCDLIIAGTGVNPNVSWLRGSNVEVVPYTDPDVTEEAPGGVKVRAGTMQTNVGGIFAAGDCTHVTQGGPNWFQMRLWTQALSAGRAAARGMAAHLGVGEEYAGLEFDVFAHATMFFGKRVALLGRYNAQGLGKGFTVYERTGDGEYVRVVVDGVRVRGAVLVGDVECAEVFENLILTEMNVGWLGQKLVDKNIDLEDFFD